MNYDIILEKILDCSITVLRSYMIILLLFHESSRTFLLSLSEYIKATFASINHSNEQNKKHSSFYPAEETSKQQQKQQQQQQQHQQQQPQRPLSNQW